VGYLPQLVTGYTLCIHARRPRLLGPAEVKAFLTWKWIVAADDRPRPSQFLSRYPVLNIHPMMQRQAAKNASVMPKLTATFTSAVP
jgi:hypothetical protein